MTWGEVCDVEVMMYYHATVCCCRQYVDYPILPKCTYSIHVLRPMFPTVIIKTFPCTQMYLYSTAILSFFVSSSSLQWLNEDPARTLLCTPQHVGRVRVQYTSYTLSWSIAVVTQWFERAMELCCFLWPYYRTLLSYHYPSPRNPNFLPIPPCSVVGVNKKRAFFIVFYCVRFVFRRRSCSR